MAEKLVEELEALFRLAALHLAKGFRMGSIVAGDAHGPAAILVAVRVLP